MSYRIVIDSCGELPEELKGNPDIVVAPLTLDVGGEQIIDNEHLDIQMLLKKIAACPTCPKSACPSPDFYEKAFDCDAEHIYAITLSSELSGSYNSAMLGRNLMFERYPDKKIHVFDSRSASIGETLIALKIIEIEKQGASFEDVVKQVEGFRHTCNTFFTLENLDTLRKNGRLGRVKSLVASALKIKPVMGSTKEGGICQLDQARGINKALLKMVDHITEKGEHMEDKILAISHCNCRERAEMVRDALLSRIKVRDTILLETGGVSSLYANDGGIIVVI